MSWLQGKYVFDAVSLAIGNALRGKGKTPQQYNEKPYSQIKREKDGSNLTEEQKKKYVDALFNRLQIMQFNFEMEKKQKNASADAK